MGFFSRSPQRTETARLSPPPLMLVRDSAPPDPDDLMTHMPSMLMHARRLMGNESDAQDLAHDTAERALRAKDRFSPGTNMRAWLLTILHRRALDFFRRSKVTASRPVEDDEMAAPEDDGPPVWASITQQQLLDAVSQLPPRLRQVFELHEQKQMSYIDMARELNIPVNTVASRLRRARERLRKTLSDLLEAESRERRMR